MHIDKSKAAVICASGLIKLHIDEQGRCYLPFITPKEEYPILTEFVLNSINL